MLGKGIEKAFEDGRIYFVLGDTDRDFFLKIWDSSVSDEPVYDGATKKIGSLVDCKLRIPRNVDPPFKRVLSDHAQRSYKHALRMGWIEPNILEPDGYGSPLKDNLLDITQKNTPTDDNESELHSARTI